MKMTVDEKAAADLATEYERTRVLQLIEETKMRWQNVHVVCTIAALDELRKRVEGENG